MSLMFVGDATGSSAACPASINVADKTRCDEDSVCYQGVSITIVYLPTSLTELRLAFGFP